MVFIMPPFQGGYDSSILSYRSKNNKSTFAVCGNKPLAFG